MKTDEQAPGPLVPDIAGDAYYRPRKFVDFSQHVPWLKSFTHFQVPADHTIEVEENQK